MGFDLPDGWIDISFMEIFDIQGGTQPPKKNFVYEKKEGYIQLLQIRDFGDRSVPTFIPFEKKLKTCNADDMLIGRYGASVGRICSGKEGAYNVALAKVIVPDIIDKKYTFFLLNSDIFQRPILRLERSAQNGFNKDDLTEIKIPIAPMNEQKRIVAKLEKLMSKVDQCKARLEKIPSILKRFRQSVLTAACSGELTKDWRKENSDLKFSAETLAWLFSQKPAKSSFPMKFEKNEEPSIDLPAKWCFVRLKNILSDLKYGTSKKCEYNSSGIPVLRIPNVVKGSIDHSDIKYADLSENEYENLKLKKGDILLIRSNGSVSLVGKTALVTSDEENFAYAGYLIRLRFDRSKLSPNYLNMALGTYSIRAQIEVPARSTSGVNNINSQEVSNLKIPLPPFEEQQEIVRQVESFFNIADQLEERYNKAKDYVDKLTQSILAKAFRGELVSQDPNDEPASKLLERIKAMKENLKPESNNRKRSFKKKTGK